MGTLGRTLGITVVMVDVEVDIVKCDLSEDHVFETLMIDICSGRFVGCMMSPPCSTFSTARSSSTSGPGPLRGEHPPKLYGLKDITGKLKEKVRLGTLLALRCATTAKEFLPPTKAMGH